MPDKDNIHSGPRGFFKKPYKQICEGIESNEDISRSALYALKKSIQRYGDEPINLINKASAQLNILSFYVSFGIPVNDVEEIDKLDDLFGNANLRDRGIQMAKDSCIASLSDPVRNGKDVELHLYKDFIDRVYRSDFEKRTPLTGHHDNADQKIVDKGLREIRPRVDSSIIKYAEQIKQRRSVKSLRLPNREIKKPSIDICDSRHRQKNLNTQCGYCTSCLLRRQSLAAADIKDRTQYVVPDDRPAKKDEKLSFHVMSQQVDVFRNNLSSLQPWNSMVKTYPDLFEIVIRNADTSHEREKMKSRLLRLFRLYVEEWDMAMPIIGKGVSDWNDEKFSEPVEFPKGKDQ